VLALRRSLIFGGAALAAAVAAVAVVFSLDGPAGSAGASSDAAALEGPEWALVSLGGRKVEGEREVSARFDNGQLTGFASINRYFGSYTVEDGRLSVGPIAATKMGGPEPLMRQEDAFLRALETASAFTRSGETLTITTDAGELVFTVK